MKIGLVFTMVWVICLLFVSCTPPLTDTKNQRHSPLAPSTASPKVLKNTSSIKTTPPRPIPSINKSKWAGQGFNLILENECGDCDNACWYNIGDKGGVTCVGVAVNRNPDFYSKVLNNAFQACKNRGIFVYNESAGAFGSMHDFCWYLRDFYWKRFVAPFQHCTYQAMIHLSDTAVLQGVRASIKILQRAHGLKADGKFGKKSQQACKNFKKQAFIRERILTLRTYKDYKRFGDGWVKRVNNLSKRI